MMQTITDTMLSKNGIIFLFVLTICIFILAEIKIRYKRCGPYKSQHYLMTQDEYAFYCVLVYALDAEKYIVCPKVRLADVVYVSGKKDRNWYRNYAKIAEKHIDFLVCSRRGQILFGIELDGNSHYSKTEKERDAQKNEICYAAGFPLLRIRSSKVYDSGSIRAYIQKKLNIML